MIHTKNGLIPIEEIKSGDEVLSYNQQTKQTEYKSVIETYVRQTEQIVKLEIEDEEKVIETTPEHPFFVRVHRARDSLLSDDDGEWKPAGALQVGDEVLSASGEWQKILDFERQTRNDQVYNFAVADNHNYFVGKQGILVHNNCEHLRGLAKEIAESGEHFFSRVKRVVAVGEDSSGKLFAASSNALDVGQQAAAKRLGVTPLPSRLGMHAEETLMNGITDLKRVGTWKRMPCGPSEHNCAGQLLSRGIEF